ncbi:MAG: biotin--[acetyl-CoA-carboxylase] ligase, partial [Bdellovibrionales bacterium]
MTGDTGGFWRIRELAVTASTNADAGKAAEKGEAEGLVVRALKQTAGKGRHGRSWESPEGNLYASLLLRPDCSPRHAVAFGFAASLAVRDVVSAAVPDVPVTLKWPNDVLADGRKIGGILLETATQKSGMVDWLVIGIGINIEQYPKETLYPATSLGDLAGTLPSPDGLLNSLLARVRVWKENLENQGFAGIRETWLTYAHKGQMSVKLPNETVAG